MNVTIHAPDPRNQIEPYVNDRLDAALDRFQAAIADITVRVFGEDSKTTSTAHRCSMDVTLTGGGVLHVQSEEPTAQQAISHAAKKLKSSLVKRLERRREH